LNRDLTTMAFAVPSRVLLDDAADVMQAGESAVRAGESQIDLAAVAESDSSLLACLLAWRRTAQAAGRTLAVLNPPASLRGLAALYGVEAITLA
jgi:phospholipid transport system transporter-binding protein